jgi:hypothetical protein
MPSDFAVCKLAASQKPVGNSIRIAITNACASAGIRTCLAGSASPEAL